jgi:imidazolonepropionase-like amidohydrolase
MRAAASAGPAAVALVNGRWYTGNGFEPRNFFIQDGVLRAGTVAAVDSVMDLGGGFVIPPFGDAHTHNLDGPFNLESVTSAYVREGTFYVAVLTNTASGAAQVASSFEGRCSIDVVYAHGGVTSTLSHPFLAYEPRAMGIYADWEARAAEIRASRVREADAYWFIDSAADLEDTWPAIAAGDPDIVKLFLLDAREDPPPMPESGLPRGHGLRPSLVPSLVARAHAAGARVAAHVETAADLRIAVEAGVDLVAHMPGYLYGSEPDGRIRLDDPTTPFEITQDVAASTARAGVSITPTVRWTYAATGPDSATAVERRQELMRRNLDVLRSRGVRIVVGSDWFGETAWPEIEAMRALGVWSDAELLHMWAVETPRTVFPSRRIGRLEDGYEASFLVLDANPLDSLDALRDIRLRVKQGCVLEE